MDTFNSTDAEHRWRAAVAALLVLLVVGTVSGGAVGILVVRLLDWALGNLSGSP